MDVVTCLVLFPGLLFFAKTGVSESFAYLLKGLKLRLRWWLKVMFDSNNAETVRFCDNSAVVGTARKSDGISRISVEIFTLRPLLTRVHFLYILVTSDYQSEKGYSYNRSRKVTVCFRGIGMRAVFAASLDSSPPCFNFCIKESRISVSPSLLRLDSS